MVLVCVVHAAGVQDRDGAKWVLAQATASFTRLRVVRADGGYAGKLVEWVRDTCLWTLEIVRRAPGTKGFVLLPKRWVVERTFGWLGKFRRLSKDYEYLPESSEAFVYVAMTHIMLRRLK